MPPPNKIYASFFFFFFLVRIALILRLEGLRLSCISTAYWMETWD